MLIWINGTTREMTDTELAAMQAEQARMEAEEKHRPMSLSEVQELLVRQQINTLAVDDQTAYRMREFYPEWAADTAYTTANGKPVGYKAVHAGRLWKLRQEHTSQTGWEPGATGTESMWTEIDEQHDGSRYDPIPYNGNMELYAGMYYSQDGVTYRCTRATGQAVFNPLADLVGIYVEVVENGT